MNNLENVMAYLKEKYSAEEIQNYFKNLNKNAKTNLKKTGAVAMTIATLLGAGATMNSCKPENPIHYETITDESGNVITDESGVPVTSEVLDTTATTKIDDNSNISLNFYDLGLTPTTFSKPDETKLSNEITSEDFINAVLYTALNWETVDKIQFQPITMNFKIDSEFQPYARQIKEISSESKYLLNTILWDTPFRDSLNINVVDKILGGYNGYIKYNFNIENETTHEDIEQYKRALEKSKEIVNNCNFDETTSEKEKATLLLKELMKISEFHAVERINPDLKTQYSLNDIYKYYANEEDSVYTTAYGALILGQADSYGFTSAYNILLKTAGIEAFPLITNEFSTKPYAVTGVVLDDVKYQIDSTCADVTGVIDSNFKGLIGYQIEDVEVKDINFKSKHDYDNVDFTTYYNNFLDKYCTIKDKEEKTK